MDGVGLDGVYRTFDSRKEVVDYKQLSPEGIEAVAKIFKGANDPELYPKTVEMLRGVDGRDVTDVRRLLNPREENIPKDSTR